ncbi:MAG: hypothetical protein ACP5N2_05930 [Candidatus Nanoarchaeia archaeon]
MEQKYNNATFETRGRKILYGLTLTVFAAHYALSAYNIITSQQNESAPSKLEQKISETDKQKTQNNDIQILKYIP